jgi:hypothetical protein
MSNTDPWQQYAVGSAPPPADSPSMATPPAATPPQSDPWQQYAVSSNTPMIAEVPATTQTDPWSKYAVGTTQRTNNPQSEPEQSTGWLGKTWDWINRPLTESALDWRPYREGATGVEKGVEEFASGLTSPLNVALAIGTMGAAPLLESLGIKLAGEAAIPVIKTVGKLAKLGFTSQMVYGLAQEYPQFQVAIKNGDTDTALEIGTKLALGGVLAFHGARELAKDNGFVDSKARANTGVDAARGERESTSQQVYQKGREVRKAVNEVIPNEVRRGALQLYTEAAGDTAKLDAWKKQIDAATDVDPKLQKQILSLLGIAQDLKPAEVAAAGKLRAYYDSLGQQGVDAGLLDGEKLGSYVARSRWTTEPAEAEKLEAAKEILNQQSGRVNHLQRRVFESTVQGVLSGYRPDSLDAGDVAADYATSIGREFGNKAYVDAALQARAKDGRPIAIPANAVRLADDGTRINTDDYSAVPSPHSKGIEFHPDAQKQAKLILAPEPSRIGEIPGAKSLLKLSSLAKETKLIGGFHWSQIGLRNLMSGVNPFGTEEIDLTDPRQAQMVSAGGLQLATPRDNSFVEESEGSGGGLVGKLAPPVGRFIKLTNDKLFGPGGYIDRSKMTAALSFADRLKESHPEVDESTRARYAGEMANNRFGGQNWVSMEKSQTYRDLVRAVFLAPDFLISNIKDGLSALGPVGNIGRFDIARIVAYNFAAARVANAFVSGKPHLEQPFGVVSPDGKEVYSVRTMPADIFGGLADPRRFVGNRLSPLLNTATELVEGRYKLGRQRSTTEQIQDLFGQFAPLPLNSTYQLATGGSASDFRPGDSALTSLGLSATKNYSPAERKALQLASHFSTSGEAVPTEQLDKLHEVMRLEDAARTGQASLDDAQRAFQAGLISPRDLQAIKKVRQEYEQYPETARLRSQVRRLPLSAALDVLKLADQNERKDLLPLIQAKTVNWRKNAARTTTPRQRAAMSMRLAEVASDTLGN